MARKIKRVGSCAAGAGGISTLGIVSAGSRRQPTQPTCHLMPLCGACRSGPPWKNPCASRARPRRQALKKLRLRSPDRADLCEPSVCDGCRNDPGRTRTCNLWFQRPTPYPLGHRALKHVRCASYKSFAMRSSFVCAPPCTRKLWTLRALV